MPDRMATPPLVSQQLARARTLTRLLDTAVRVPFTNIRFGLDPVLGLIPGLGDVAGAVLSGYVVLLAARLGAPRATLLRMLANVAIDTGAGSLPILGDLFDVAWKSNSRNLALLERVVGLDASTRAAPPAASRAAVAGTLIGLTLLAVAGLVVAFVVVRAAVHFLGAAGS